jgi:hypothetical protein
MAGDPERKERPMSVTATEGSATDTAQEAGAQAKDKAQQAGAQARDRVREQVDQRSTQAGEQAGSAADALRKASEQLRNDGNEPVAKGMEQVARRIDSAGGWLRDSDGDTILRDVEDFGRRNPLAVVAGGLAIGFAASRLLKASSRQRYETGSRTGDGGPPPMTTGPGATTGAPPPATGTIPPEPPLTTGPGAVTPPTSPGGTDPLRR